MQYTLSFRPFCAFVAKQGALKIKRRKVSGGNREIYSNFQISDIGFYGRWGILPRAVHKSIDAALSVIRYRPGHSGLGGNGGIRRVAGKAIYRNHI